ncbi:DUF4395 domain-containing protein [Halovivax sp.]|uniref:DUF4395 domain-containing protein n=1 Tax=Halovivax sp. TaxID=1935978 RepID=UPI0025BDD2D1|nr:DUF4395 domain-containing protein [Halovivax sp.]
MNDLAASAGGSIESRVDLVDPRAPRFGQAITATLLLAGAAAGAPALVYAVAAILGLAALTRWRLDLYAVTWRRLAIPIVGAPPEREPATPHRFAKLLGAGGSLIASLLLVLGLFLPGFAIAAFVGLLAALGATTGFCLGCQMYRQVSVLRRRGVL